MADKKTEVSYLPETDQEAIDANQAYREAYQALQASLDVRKNRLFDPTLLAVAQAFATPTKTGSAFESLGHVAGALNEQQALREKEEQDIAEKRMQVAGSGLELLRQKKQQELLWGGKPQGVVEQPSFQSPAAVGTQAPATGGLPSGQPKVASADKTDVAGGLPAMSFMGEPVTPEEVTLLRNMQLGRATPEQMFKTLMDTRKTKSAIQRDRYVPDGAGGIYDTITGKTIPKTGSVEISVAGKTYKVPQWLGSRYESLMSEGNYGAALGELNKYWASQGGGAGVPAGAPAGQTSGIGQPGRILSEDERKAAEAQDAASRETAKKRFEELSSLAEKADQSLSSITLAQNLLKRTPDVSGLFSGPGGANALMRFVTKSIPGSEEAIAQTVFTKEQLNDRERLVNILDNIAIELTKRIENGAGSVSTFERQADAALSANISQSPEVIKTILAVSKERAKFLVDKKNAYDEWASEDRSRNLVQFEASKQYKRMLADYDRKLYQELNKIPGIELSPPASMQEPVANPNPARRDRPVTPTGAFLQREAASVSANQSKLGDIRNKFGNKGSQ